MDSEDLQQITVIMVAVGAASAAYGKGLGSTQTQIVQWVIDALEVQSRWRGLLNLAIGMLLALSIAALAALQTGEWAVAGVGVLGGVLASVEAARAHDQANDNAAA